MYKEFQDCFCHSCIFLVKVIDLLKNVKFGSYKKIHGIFLKNLKKCRYRKVYEYKSIQKTLSAIEEEFIQKRKFSNLKCLLNLLKKYLLSKP